MFDTNSIGKLVKFKPCSKCLVFEHWLVGKTGKVVSFKRRSFDTLVSVDFEFSIYEEPKKLIELDCGCATLDLKQWEKQQASPYRILVYKPIIVKNGDILSEEQVKTYNERIFDFRSSFPKLIHSKNPYKVIIKDDKIFVEHSPFMVGPIWGVSDCNLVLV